MHEIRSRLGIRLHCHQPDVLDLWRPDGHGRCCCNGAVIQLGNSRLDPRAKPASSPKRSATPPAGSGSGACSAENSVVKIVITGAYAGVGKCRRVTAVTADGAMKSEPPNNSADAQPTRNARSQ